MFPSPPETCVLKETLWQSHMVTPCLPVQGVTRISWCFEWFYRFDHQNVNSWTSNSVWAVHQVSWQLYVIFQLLLHCHLKKIRVLVDAHASFWLSAGEFAARSSGILTLDPSCLNESGAKSMKIMFFSRSMVSTFPIPSCWWEKLRLFLGLSICLDICPRLFQQAEFWLGSPTVWMAK